MLREIGNKLQTTLLYATTKDPFKKEIDLFIKKIYKLSNVLLWSAKEKRSIKLNRNSIQYTSIEENILRANQHILALGEPFSLLLRKQTTMNEILVDPELFECFLMLNLWEVNKSKQNGEHMVTLTITDTVLQYNYTVTPPIGQIPLSLPALAFWFSTDSVTQNTKAFYTVSEIEMPLILPTSKEQFYQLESRQIVEAHGGYTAITENDTILTCLYVLPVNGQQVMQLKNYDPVDLVANKLAETADSVMQEQALTKLLIQETTLSEEVIVQTIDLIKKAHGLVIRQSGVPYYTHPMTVVEILLEVTKDPTTILAGLLHDVIEDTPITLHQIDVMYGTEVASIVAHVTAYNTNGYPWKLRNEENKNKLNQCDDSRVVQVKLADRLHNLRTLYARKPVDQQRIAQETVTFYIPWGEKNKGPTQWLLEMQRICTQILQKKQ
ncbi:HD domain-containing protein [Candidatus Cardinium hertigii]|uniref:Bifunctional (P)ppGpp synthetase/guanosine-3',5'-bis(Diphosphate) 3'-pyrophosphohydrolase n=1 Tax=Candidatus Cardinium hertigii TaxID=247481 RepID=A0A3N2QAV3_9BACT|nr:HD domain-containing protein [Candidatus Cardinium hertigii]ROT46926.1 bifunctional (p)ppGpp synthetase/guanosine-3',5'-bis(diphosphate) 3'-pyrophosphohydrolase [Candidatus Cardinium hertigii]